MTATKVGLSSRRLCLITAVFLAATACAATNPATGAKGGAATESRTATVSPPVTGGKGGSPSPIAGVVDPSVRCVRQFTGTAMALIGQALYDVTDPVHPSLLCVMSNTSTRLFTADTFEYIRRSGTEGTEVVLHSIGSGNERVVAGWPLNLWNLPMGGYGVWTPDGNSAATFVAGTDAAGNATLQVWLFAQSNKTELYEFPQPLTDCICRFGLPPPVLAFSADGQYLVSGWPIGKGATPIRVYRVADQTLVATLNYREDTAFWDRKGHSLFVSGRDATNVRLWTPEDGFRQISPTNWPYAVVESPDGNQVAFTAYTDPANFQGIRIYVFYAGAGETGRLIDQPRSEALYVKDDWVWYHDEVTCDPQATGCSPWGSHAGNKTFAKQVTVGTETQVVFAPGESPAELQSGWSGGQFWPNS